MLMIKSFGGKHFGFPFNIKNTNFAKDNPMAILIKFGSNHFYCF
jgi:hypothetical protein